MVSPFLLCLLLVGTIAVGLRTAAAVGEEVPRLEDQEAVELPQTSRIYAADGQLLAYIYGSENRTVIGRESIPQLMKDAIVAVEDERFYEHRGVDFEAVVRALIRDIEAGRTVEGGSTITQQLVGNLYLDRRDNSFTRKFKEMVLAWQLESRLSKDEILEQYLNTVFFGSNAYGIEAAARTYFDKHPQELRLEEIALLAGLPQAPTAYSPRKHPDAARNRRDQVLYKMYENGYIGHDEYIQAVNTPLRLAPSSPYTRVQQPYVVDYVRRELIEMFGEDRVYKGGLTVQTTINPAYQKLASDAIASTLDRPGDPSAALLAVETRTGYIRAMVGGTDYDVSKFNLAAQAKRQPGSAFKTFALTAAVEMGINPATTYYVSRPVSIHIPSSRRPWNVETYARDYYGVSNLVQATLRSDNTVYAQLAMDVGADKIVDVARRMGIRSRLNPNPAIVLGGLTYGVSPLDMASAYATLANEGVHVEPTIILRVQDSNGKVIWEAEPKKTQAISAGVAYVVTKILEQNVQSGTGTRAKLYGRPAAGKTGTAQNYYDAWFVGYTRQLSTAVWVGHPEAQVEMRSVHGIRVTGGSFPAIIWRKFMEAAASDYPVEHFRTPQDMVEFKYNFESDYTASRDWSNGYTSSSGTITLFPTGLTGTSIAPPLTNPPPDDTVSPTTTRPPPTQPTTTRPPTTRPPTTSPPSTRRTTTTTRTTIPPPTGPQPPSNW